MRLSERIIGWLAGEGTRAGFFAVPLVVLGALLAATSVVAWKSQEQELRLNRAYFETTEFLDVTYAAEHATLQIIRGQRGYLLTGNPKYLLPYREGRAELAQSLASLHAFAKSDHGKQESVRLLDAQSDTYVLVQEDIVRLAQSGQRANAMKIVLQDRGRAAIETIRSLLKSMRGVDEARLATIQKQAQGNQERQRLFFYLVSAVGLALMAVASLAIVALRRVAAREMIYREELRLRAETDELTGLANRRELIAGLRRALAGADRNGSDLAFALFDIDHFKLVNDAWGHPVGDQVIRHISEAAIECVRGGDLVGRIGGEEFGIVLPNAGVAQAYAVCERIRQRIQSSAIALADGTCVEVTVSIGIARRFEGDSVETLIERADAALYQAKHGGRDQVRLAA